LRDFSPPISKNLFSALLKWTRGVHSQACNVLDAGFLCVPACRRRPNRDCTSRFEKLVVTSIRAFGATQIMHYRLKAA